MKMLLLALVLFVQRPPSTALQTGAITGRLLNEDGTPAVKVRVSAMSIPDTQGVGNLSPTLITLTETDNTGRYRLADVPVGRYYVVAGFVDSPTYYPRGTSPSAATPVNVTFNATAANIDFRIERPSTGLTVSGRVISEASSAFGTLQINLTGNSNGSFSNANVAAKLDGSFEFVRVRPGTYNLSVNPSPFPDQRSIVVADKDVTGLELRIPWTGEVTGRVVVDGGGPSPAVTGLFAGGGRFVNTYIGANQTFRATLPEGFFAFTATTIPAGFYIKSVTSGKTDLLTTPINVSKTGLPPEVLVTLGVSTPSPWVRLSGRITAGAPASAMSITLSGPSGSLDTTVAPDGSFEFPKILPGNYTAAITGAATPGIPGQSLTVIVPNRDVAGLELALPIMKEVPGRIVVENGGPVPRPALMITPVDQSVRRPVSAPPSLAQLLVVTPTRGGPTNAYINNILPDGTFKVSLPAGQYPLTAQVQVYGTTSPFSVKSFTYGSTDLTKEPITVGSESSGELVLTLAPASANSWVKVTGRVTGLNSTASNPSVALYSSIFVTSLTATVRPDGSFEFPRVYTGTYQARINGITSSLGLPGIEVNVGTSDLSGVEFALPREKELSGRIILEGRGPMFRLNLPLISTGGAGVGPMANLSISPKPDGTFRVTVPEGERQLGRPSGLPPGYSLKSVHYGATDLAGSSLKVTATDTAELRLTVTTPDFPPVKVSGRVKGLDAAAFDRGPINIALNDPRFVTTPQVNLTPDGSFTFPEVFPGTYIPRLSVPVSNIKMPTVNVGSADVTDVEITVPRMKEVAGRITVEGSGPIPRFNIPLTRVDDPLQAHILSIAAQPDMTFRVTIPEGQFKIGQFGGLPAGYSIKSMHYGATDLAGGSITVSVSDTAEFRLTVNTSDMARFKISGKVTGLDPTAFSRGPVNINLSEPRYPNALQSAVSQDGSFVFSNVPPGNYTARLSASVPNVGLAALPVNVIRSDVGDIEIVVPRQKEIAGRIVLEGSGPMPAVSVPFISATSAASGPATANFSVPLNPRSDGTFRVTIPEGERRIGQISGLPQGYAVKSIFYGNANVTTAPFKVASSDTSELRVTVSTPNHSPVKVSGRVRGLDGLTLSRGPMNVTMSAPGYAGNLQAIVAADGSFQFAEVFPGNYSARIVNLGAALEPVTVAVANSDIQNVEITMPGQKEVAGRVVLEGSAPMPRFSFLPQFPGSVRTPLATQVINIIPGPNGSFRLVLAEGQRSLGQITGLPPGYALKAATYGTTDLLREPLTVARTDTAELVFTVSAPALKGVAVRGKVEGLDPSILARGVSRVVLVSPTFAGNINTPVKPDGTFEFPSVFRGNYLAQVSSPTLVDRATAEPAGTPSNDGNTPPTGLVGIAAAGTTSFSIVVGESDVNDLNLTVPRQHLILGHVEVLGGGPLPRVPMTFSGPPTAGGFGANVLLVMSPQADGRVRFTLPEGERFVSVGQLPPGYALKSLTYGNIDLRQSPLTLQAGRATSELRVTLEKVPSAAALVRVSGKVTGLSSDAQNIRVGLVGTFNVPQEVPVNPDGTFSFPQVFQGPSSVRLLGNIGVPLPAPLPFIAGPGGATNLEIVIQH